MCSDGEWKREMKADRSESGEQKALVFHALPLRLSPPCRGGAAARFLCCSAAAADGSSGRGSSDGKARFSPLPPNQAFSEVWLVDKCRPVDKETKKLLT
ncbi:hypothetical protein ZWY2020_040818 [Hordeum vulgare]|nr:hypothetical protein ZWY2020_040818 [Hordeum vulgare]